MTKLSLIAIIVDCQPFLPNHKWIFDFHQKNQGFCLRGNKKEITCAGDSGSPAILKQNDKDILIGILRAGQTKCGKMWMQSSTKRLPKKSIQPSKYVAVPGKLMEWILKKGGKDIKVVKCHHQRVTAVWIRNGNVMNREF